MSITKIQWTDMTLNPLRAQNIETGKVGWYCTHVSEGCRNCYAETMNNWIGTGLDYKEQNSDRVKLFLDPHLLKQPLRIKKGKRIFMCSMTDLFHDDVGAMAIDAVFAMMAGAERHTFQILTKRPERMLSYISTPGRQAFVERDAHISGYTKAAIQWPLPNVWLGVSCEDQKTYTERVELLIATPAAKSFISYEPALEGIDLNAVGDWWESGGLDWVIVGGESGSRARPFNVAWARNVVRQVKDVGKAVFVKQLGGHVMWDGIQGGDIPCWPAGPKWFDAGNGMFEGFLKDKKGGDPAEWPEDLRVREFPR